SYRNRCYIATDIGRHPMNIPIQHTGCKQGRQKYKDVKVDNFYHWQRQHWRTLETAYRTSPFFEFYEDDLVGLYKTEHTFLLDFNLKSIEAICNCLQIQMPTESTSEFEKQPIDYVDARHLINAKTNPPLVQNPYVQVFDDRNPFIDNLSILDLLFNEGTNALSYLKEHQLEFKDA
ncbi:MAG: WbqC family protein, partial [Flavobacteriales bacterium]